MDRKGTCLFLVFSQGDMKDLRPWRRTWQEPPKLAVSGCSAPPDRPTGRTRLKEAPRALGPRSLARPVLLTSLLPSRWTRRLSRHPSSRTQWPFDPVKWPLIMPAGWRHRTVYGAALPEQLDGWGQRCSKNAGNASQMGSWRLVLTFIAIFKIPLSLARPDWSPRPWFYLTTFISRGHWKLRIRRVIEFPTLFARKPGQTSRFPPRKQF